MDFSEGFVMFGEKIDENSHKLRGEDLTPFIGEEFYRARCEAQRPIFGDTPFGDTPRAERIVKTLILNGYSKIAITTFAGSGTYALDRLCSLLK